MGLRERKKEKTKQALVRSALRQFAKRGFDQVTVEDIAGACDVSPRTFFRYFGSKEDVLFADADAQRVRMLEALRSQPPEVPALRALQAAALDVASDCEGRCDALLLRHRIVERSPCLRSHVAERHFIWEQALADELRGSGRAGDMSELTLRLTVAAAITALGVATEIWIDGNGEGDLRALLVTAVEQLRTGLDP
jgi:AcrR family transcriptional regulator